jgi:hypothetical protein
MTDEDFIELIRMEGPQEPEFLLQVSKKNNHLYINGKKILVEKKVTLRWYELFLLTLTTIAIAISGLESLLNIFKKL